jgi:hypothetical protein
MHSVTRSTHFSRSTIQLDAARKKCDRIKAPGVDDLPTEVYRLDDVWIVVGPYLHAALVEAEQIGRLPDSMRGRPSPSRATELTAHFPNYRPISTINTDMKIKDMADKRRLADVITSVICAV